MISNKVRVHFHSPSGVYDAYSVWQWVGGQQGREQVFSGTDSFGRIADLTYEAEQFLSDVYLLVKRGDWQSQSCDFQVRRDSGIPQTEVWIVDGDETLYYSRQAAVTSLFYRQRDPHAFDMVLSPQSFDSVWGFDGWLGFSYDEKGTIFRLWAPTAEQVSVVLYETTADDASIDRIISMSRGNLKNEQDHRYNTHGVWFARVEGDLNGKAYRYRIYDQEKAFRDSRDPYAIAVTASGQRSVVLAPTALVPEGFSVRHGEAAPWRLSNPNQIVVSEVHIRDFSMSETSGVSKDKRGKFLGACQTGTTNAFGEATTFDYLKTLGVTHVQFQPVFDHHQIILDDGSYAYNWGYDPENYNVPDASFTSNPNDPATRILELKQLIQAYHDAGLGVVLDVVYNHTYSSIASPFQLTVPDYYYRMNADGSFQNGSGCGNETASEKEMFRKYMIDSLTYWVTAYGVDGFRFDLMGLHDVETMRAIRVAMDAIDPNILLYGEGWDMGTGLLPEAKAKKDNAHLLPRIGFFNDDLRDAIKGAEVYGALKTGFVSGAPTESVVAKGLLGSDELAPYLSPGQVLNYVEAHDNYNLHDLLQTLHPEDDLETLRQRIELALVLQLLMPGMTFMQIGQEFLRSKLYPTGPHGELTAEDRERAMNAYNAPDVVNQVNWNQVMTHRQTVELVRQLLHWRRSEPLLALESFEAIRQHRFVSSAVSGSGLVSLSLGGEKTFTIIFNSRDKKFEIRVTED